MAITRHDLETNRFFHYEGPNKCVVTFGPKGGITYKVEEWRTNGELKTWKRDSNRVKLPVKHGMYSFGYITENDFDKFHTLSNCPVRSQIEEYERSLIEDN